MSHRPNRVPRTSTALAVVVVASCLAVVTIPAFVGGAGAVERVTRSEGAGRVETAVAVAVDHWDRAGTVLLASAGDFPDALAATPLAAALDAPLLLTPAEFLPDDVARAIIELDADEVIVLGGTNAVSTAVESALQGLTTTPTVRRIAAADRFTTAAEIAREAGAPEGIAVVASGEGFADALAAGTFASTDARPPVLLAIDRAVPTATLDALADLDIDTVLLVGGTSVLSEAVAIELIDAGYDVERISGTNRFETAAAVIEHAYTLGLDTRTLIAATAGDFPDALAAGPLAAHTDGAVLLATPETIPDPIGDAARVPGATGVVIGGTNALSPSIVAQLVELLGNPVTGHLAIDGDELTIDHPITFDPVAGPLPSFRITGASTRDLVSVVVYDAEIRRVSDDRRFNPTISILDREGTRLEIGADQLRSAAQAYVVLRNCPCLVSLGAFNPGQAEDFRATFRMVGSSAVPPPVNPATDGTAWDFETTRFGQRAFLDVQLEEGDFAAAAYEPTGPLPTIPERPDGELRSTPFMPVREDNSATLGGSFGTASFPGPQTRHGYAPARGRYRVSLEVAYGYGPGRVVFTTGRLTDIDIGGEAVDLVIDQPGRPVGVRFDGVADQHLVISYVTEVTGTDRLSCDLRSRTSEQAMVACNPTVLDGPDERRVQLRSSGTHQLYLIPQGLGTGTISVQIDES